MAGAPAAPLVKRDAALVETHRWTDVQGRQIEASIRAVQFAFSKPGQVPTPQDCLRAIMAAKSRGWDLWNGDIQLVQYQAGQPAGLVTNYLMFTAEAQKAGGPDYLPPEFQIDIDEESGFPTRGRVQMRRASWPRGVYRQYPVDGGYIRFQDLAPKVMRNGKVALRATWAEPASGRHMFAKTLEARVTRLVWADATRGLYLREEAGTFRMLQDMTPHADGEPAADVDWVEDGEVVSDGLDLPTPPPPGERDLCPVCKSPWVQRNGPNGLFWTCSRPKGAPNAQGRNAKGYCSGRPPEGYDGPTADETPATEAADAPETPQETPESPETGESTPGASEDATEPQDAASPDPSTMTPLQLITALRGELERTAPRTAAGKPDSAVIWSWVDSAWGSITDHKLPALVQADRARCEEMLAALRVFDAGTLRA